MDTTRSRRDTVKAPREEEEEEYKSLWNHHHYVVRGVATAVYVLYPHSL